MSFHEWLHDAWTDLLRWFGVEEQKIASFMYPIFMDAKSVVEKNFLQDIINGVPVVVEAMSGGIPAALVAAEEFLLPLLEKQGVALAQTTINTLANALVAQAQASINTAPVE